VVNCLLKLFLELHKNQYWQRFKSFPKKNLNFEFVMLKSKSGLDAYWLACFLIVVPLLKINESRFKPLLKITQIKYEPFSARLSFF